MKQKRVPQRMCIGCGQMKPKAELVRIVNSKTDGIGLDETGKKAGRGAYICRDVECLQKARKAKRIERAFSCAIAPTLYDELERGLDDDSE